MYVNPCQNLSFFGQPETYFGQPESIPCRIPERMVWIHCMVQGLMSWSYAYGTSSRDVLGAKDASSGSSELVEELPDHFRCLHPGDLIGPIVPMELDAVMFDEYVLGTITVNHVLDVHVVM